MGKASSVGMDVRRRKTNAIAADTNPHLRRQRLQKIPEAQAATQVGKLLPSSTNGLSLVN